LIWINDFSLLTELESQLDGVHSDKMNDNNVEEMKRSEKQILVLLSVELRSPLLAVCAETIKRNEVTLSG